MIFKIERSLEDKVFTSVVKFKGFGGTILTEEEEKTILNDFGAPSIDLGIIDYTGKFKVTPGIGVEIDTLTGEEISFVLNRKNIKVNELFNVSYSVDAKKIKVNPLTDLILNTPELKSEAMCILFENKIAAEVIKAINSVRENKTSFESNAPSEFTV